LKAVFFAKHGGPEVLQYGDFPDPAHSASQVLIEVKAAALNHLDIWVRNGLPGIPIPLPHIPGSDACGVVLDPGSAKHLKKGQRVIVSPGQLLPHHPEFLQGRDSYSPEFKVMGLQTQGTYAEKVSVDPEFAIPVSDRYSFEEWAGVSLTAVTAYHMLVTRAALQKGETVLVHAAGSGVGSVAIQLAKHLGAKVFTTVGSRDKMDHAKKLGADEVILYREKDYSEEVKKLTNGRGVDVVFEHIGTETWHKNLMSLARGGRMVTCGATSGPKAEVEIRFLFSKQLSILGSYMGSMKELRSVLELFEKGTLKPAVDKVFPLREARQAQERMEARLNLGKIILTP
jgi:NADPH:quinone reductase-like Zn-dependent oxidoreductase